MLNKKVFVELSTFGIIGLVLLIIDFGIYRFLYNLNNSIEISKAISYAVGTLVSFYLNKRLTFNKNYSHGNLVKFFILYFTSFTVNITLNSVIYNSFSNFIVAYSAALIVAVIINFLGQKYWVFK